MTDPLLSKVSAYHKSLVFLKINIFGHNLEIPSIVEMVVVTKKVIGHVDPIHKTAGTYRDVGTVASINVLCII